MSRIRNGFVVERSGEARARYTLCLTVRSPQSYTRQLDQNEGLEEGQHCEISGKEENSKSVLNGTETDLLSPDFK